MTPDLRLVAACCSWPDDENRSRRIAAAAAKIGDWDRVLGLAQAHRVEGLVAQGLAASEIEASAALRRQLERLAGQVRERSLADLAETLRLTEAFERAAIAPIVLKGVPLGIQAYGSASLKRSWDIDLLVRPAQVVAAGKILGELGYALSAVDRPWTSAEFERWSVFAKEAEFRSAGGRTVELHWRLADYAGLLEPLEPWNEATRIDLIGGRTVPVLEPSANLAYLAVHGALHGWSRLKWLADFGALARAQNDPERALERAASFQPGRAIGQALMLCERYMGERIAGIPPADAATNRLFALASEVIERRSETADLDADRKARAAIRRSAALVARGRRHRLNVAIARLRGSEDRRHLRLPRPLWPLYWLIRPITAAVRFAARRL